ncbi:MAG: hypothetical protein JWM82_3693, partial [Myxococcales bacterium]|nr:hypothetical protein [Myxococcales bacterium]
MSSNHHRRPGAAMSASCSTGTCANVGIFVGFLLATLAFGGVAHAQEPAAPVGAPPGAPLGAPPAAPVETPVVVG